METKYFWDKKPGKRQAKIPPEETYLNWPEPYNWMMYDLCNSIKADANYLVGLGLFCYSEIIGRKILRQRNPKVKPGNRESFNTFVGKYMGYEDVTKHPGIYDWFRNGLCHEYTIKLAGGMRTGINHFYEDDSVEALKKAGFDTKKGIAISQNGEIRYLVIEPYLLDFKKGIEKYLREIKAI